MSPPVVAVSHLKKSFGSSTVVDDISFSIREGEIVGLLGPNGAGKTTTLYMLLGLITPTSGRIEIFGKPFEAHREDTLRKMNFSSSYTHLPWRLTVWENLYVVALLYGISHPKQKVEDVIGLMHLQGVRNKTISDLSSGWTARVNLARIFLNSPRLVLLDEPTVSLDPEAAMNVRTEMLVFRNRLNNTILWTSHNMAEIEEVCDRVIFLQKGKILAEDTPQALARRVKRCRVSFMLEGQKDAVQTFVSENGWQSVSSDRYVTVEISDQDVPRLLDGLSREGITYNEISIEKPKLEDFFLSFGTAQHVAHP